MPDTANSDDDIILIGDIDLTADDFVIPVGDFAGWHLPFNDPLLRLNGYLTGFGFTNPDTRSDGLAIAIPVLNINILPVWQEYSGAGAEIASVEHYQHSHPDLVNTAENDQEQYLDHGTSVAGIIVAEADNGIGGVGIAYGAHLSFYDEQAGIDIVHSSGGANNLPIFLSTSLSDVDEAQTANGRSGLGTVFVNSAGNGGYLDEAVEVTQRTSTFEIIPVAMASSFTGFSYGSAFGSAVHITGLSGGAAWEDFFTTDVSGDAGQINQDNVVALMAQITKLGYVLSDFGVGGSDYTIFNGTSGTAPMVSGAVALMLEASGNNIFGAGLGWRDVQEILAISARHLGSDFGADTLGDNEHHFWTVNGAATINGGGYHFSPDYGFGYLDVHGAVRLAETWGLTRTSHNLVTETVSADVPEGGLTFGYGNAITFRIEAPGDALDLDVFELVPVFSHEAYRQVQITVTSPDGTVSVLFDTPGLTTPEATWTWLQETYGPSVFGGTFEDRSILSRAFWGEASKGVWTITIEDMVDDGIDGTLTSLDINWKGDLAGGDTTYYLTLDWQLMNEVRGDLAMVGDALGANSLNLAVLMDGVNLDLAPGSTGLIGGVEAFRLADDAIITTAIGTDQGDRFTGTDRAEALYGMQGDDTLEGGAGADTLIGGAGSDTAAYSTASVAVSINLATGVRTGDAAENIYVSIENLTGSGFDDSLTGDRSDNRLEGGAGADTLIGGEGRDWVSYAGSSDGVTLAIRGGGWSDGAGGDAEGDRITQVENAEGSAYADSLTGNIFANHLMGGDGNDTLSGGTGLDTIEGGLGDDSIRGNYTADELSGDAGDDFVAGGYGSDTIHGGDGNDTLSGEKALDLMYGGDGDDLIGGGTESDTLYGDAGDDTLRASEGADNLYGGDGADSLDGGKGRDTLDGGGGDDTLTGGSEPDTFVFAAGHGDDTITDLQAGKDMLDLSATNTDFTSLADVQAAASAATVDGIAGVLIDTGGGDSLFLEGIGMNQLAGLDFVV